MVRNIQKYEFPQTGIDVQPFLATNTGVNFSNNFDLTARSTFQGQNICLQTTKARHCKDH